MASLEEELRLDEEENKRELAFIRERIPSDSKHYSDQSILYMMDSIVDYYYTSGILESDDEEVEIDLQAVVDYVIERAREDGVNNLNPDDVFFIVQADLDFQEQNL